MRLTVIINLTALVLAGSAVAQQNGPFALPPVSIDPSRGAPPPTTPGTGPGSSNSSTPGANTSRGANRAYDNLNRKLRGEVDRVNPSVPQAPLDARSPDVKVGVVNIPAVQQQYGRNFGVSVQPYRPPAPVYTSPVAPRPH